MASDGHGGQTTFDRVETAFRQVCAGPRGLRLDLDTFEPRHGLRRPPGRIGPISLVGLREVLLTDPAVTYPGITAVWAELVTRAQPPPAPAAQPDTGPASAQTGGSWQGWQVGCVGMALPALKGMHRRLCHRGRGPDDQVQAALVAGLLGGLRRASPAAPRLPAPLLWAAWRAGLDVAGEARAWAETAGVPLDDLVGSAAPPAPFGHPDLVLAHAVLGGLLTRLEAGLISETRIGGRSLVEVARDLGITANAVGLRRRKAETRLVAALRDGSLTRHGYHPPAEQPQPAAGTTSRPAGGQPAGEQPGGKQSGVLAAPGGKHPNPRPNGAGELGGKGSGRQRGVPQCHTETPHGASAGVRPAGSGHRGPQRALTPTAPLPAEGGPPNPAAHPAGHHHGRHRRARPATNLEEHPMHPARPTAHPTPIPAGGMPAVTGPHRPGQPAAAHGDHGPHTDPPAPADPPNPGAGPGSRRGRPAMPARPTPVPAALVRLASAWAAAVPAAALVRVAAAAAVVVVLLVLVAGGAAWADPGTVAAAGRVVAAPASVADVIGRLRMLIVGLLAGLATLFLTIGGVRYLAANGDPGGVAKAKEAFKNAAFGYALAALAPLLVSLLQQVVS